jgi:putative endonuclease
VFRSAHSLADPRHQLGAAAEAAAVTHLANASLQILLRNWRRRGGELDIVAREGDVLVIVEVRVRSSDDFGSAAATVDHVKQRRIIRTTQQLLQQQPALARLRVRFDVIAAQPKGSGFTLQWIKHAFSAD